MIEVLVAALITRLDSKAPPAMPQPTLMDRVRLAVLLIGLLVALGFAHVEQPKQMSALGASRQMAAFRKNEASRTTEMERVSAMRCGPVCQTC